MSRCATFCDLPLDHPGEHQRVKFEVSPLGVLAVRLWLEERSGGHQLLLESVKDLMASCSCGRWSLARPTTSRDSWEDLHAVAEEEHQRHVRWAVQQERQAVKDTFRGMEGQG